MNRLKQLVGTGRAIVASVLCLLSLVLLAPSAWAAEKATNVTYLDAEGKAQTTNAVVITEATTFQTWHAGWYVVTNEVTLSKGADCAGAVHLILADTGKLTISSVNGKAGIGVSGGVNSLAIYGQTLGTGALDVTGGVNGAGIGGAYRAAGSNITINGGKVTATGGAYGAGIGGGYGGAGSNITINVGTVMATGGSFAQSSIGAAGIGGGDSGEGSNITINGGTVTATGASVTLLGANGGSGIGGTTAKEIRINGGKVTATGGNCGNIGNVGAGIGFKLLSKIYAADDVIVKAGTTANPTTEIAHTGTTDLANDTNFAGKQYATTEKVPPPAEVTVTDVTGATAKVYTNEVEITERPAVIKYGSAFDVTYTADENYMFPGGYKTFTTNLTANADEITVTLTADQQPVAVEACTNCITFSASEPFGIKFYSTTEKERHLEYSTDRTYWATVPPKTNSQYAAVLAGEEYKIYFRGLNNTGLTYFYQKSFRSWFTNTADSVATAIACSGNVETLLDYREVAKGNHPKMDRYAFAQLFMAWKELTTAPELPAENLAYMCYNKMFSLMSITDIPELNVASVTNRSCFYMFADCSNLIVNATGPGKPWTIPSDVQISDDAKFNEGKNTSYWAVGMFKGTAGTVTNGVEIVPGKTYYVASAPAKLMAVTKPEGATVTAITTNDFAATLPCAITYATKISVTYTADPGYVFAGDQTTFTTNLYATADEMTVTLAADQQPKAIIAQIVVGTKTNGYTSLSNAFDKVQSGQTIEVLKDCDGDGILISAGHAKQKNVTVDFGGHTFTCTKPHRVVYDYGYAVYLNQKDSSYLFKNGTIAMAPGLEKAQKIVDSSCDLTLEDMTLDGRNLASMQGGHICLHAEGGKILVTNSVVISTNSWAIASQDNTNLGDGSTLVEVAGDSVVTGRVELLRGDVTLAAGEYAYDTEWNSSLFGYLDMDENEAVAEDEVEKVAKSTVLVSRALYDAAPGNFAPPKRFLWSSAGASTLRLVKAPIRSVKANKTTGAKFCKGSYFTISNALEAIAALVPPQDLQVYLATNSEESVCLHDVGDTFALDTNKWTYTGTVWTDTKEKAAVEAKVDKFDKTVTTYTVRHIVDVDLTAANATIWTNGAPVATMPFQVFSNDVLKVTYKANPGYYFADGTQEFAKQIKAAADPTTGPADGKDYNAYKAHVCDGKTFTKRITDTATLQALFENGGAGYLASNVTLTTTVVNGAGDGVFLCLNGQTLDTTSCNLSIKNTLELYDCGTTTNYFTIGEDGLWTRTYDATQADTNLVGGVVTGGNAAYPPLAVSTGAQLTIHGGNYVGVKAGDHGGVICADGATDVSIKGGTFAGNVATKGGVINANQTESVTIDGGTFIGNVAQSGGVIYTKSSVTAIIDGGTFADNTAEKGGVYYSNENTCSLTVNGGSFTGNKAADGKDLASGTVFYNQGAMTLQGDAVISNNVGVWGTIYNFGRLTVTGDVQVVDNVATGDGGAIYNRRFNSFYMGKCSVYGGTFTGNGNYAAFVNEGGTFELGVRPVIGMNGSAEGFCDLEVRGTRSFALSEQYKYDPPAGQMLMISAYAADGTNNFITVLTGATADDLDRFETVSEGYTLKYKDNTLYLEKPYTLTFASTYTNETGRVIGTVTASNGVYEIASGTNLWTGTQVAFAATPTYTNEARYVLTRWTTNGVAWTTEKEQSLAMPSADLDVAADFAWQTNYTKRVTVASNTTWEVFANETYAHIFTISAGGCAYGEGATFENVEDSAIKNNGCVAWTNVISRNNSGTKNGSVLNTGSMLLVGCTFAGNSAALGSGGGIFNSKGLLTLVDCTFTGNSARTPSGALCNLKAAEVVLRGTNTFETATDTVHNAGTLTWDFTCGGMPYVATCANVSNAATFKIAFDATLANGEYAFLGLSAGAALQGTKDFTLTDGSSEKVCTPDATDWTYVGAKRFKIEFRYSDEPEEYVLVVEPGIPHALDFDPSVEGGSVAASTNGAAIAAGTKVYPGEQVDLVFTPSNNHWQVSTNSLKLVDATNKTYEVAYFSDVTLTGANFKMTETNATFSAEFAIAETYRAELLQAVTNSYLATSNNLETLRQNRLTDDETDAALASAHGSFAMADSIVSSAKKPYLADAATNELAKALAKFEADARAKSDAKPYDLAIAADFSGAPFEDVVTNEQGEVVTFTYAGGAYTNGFNAFMTFTEAYTKTDIVPFVTNVHVFGAQTIASAPTMALTWNLDLVTYEDDEGVTNAAVVTVGKDDNGELVNITNKLGQITGAGEIVLSKTEEQVAPTIYDEFIADDAEIGVTNVGAEPKKEGGDITVDVKDGAKTETTEEGETLVVLPGVENLDGNIEISVWSDATNDVLVAGTVCAPAGTVTISNGSTNELTLAHAVEANAVTIMNSGREEDAEGSILATEIRATGDVTIDNAAHLEANVVAGGKIKITNGAIDTLVGTYDGAEISLTGDKAGSISNVTFVSDGPVAMRGMNVLTGPFAITAPANAITNSGILAWSVKGDDTATFLWDYAAIVRDHDAKPNTILIDANQAGEDPAYTNSYTLAAYAASAEGVTFVLKGEGTFVPTNLVVGGEKVIVDKKMYSLALDDEQKLVFTVEMALLKVRFQSTPSGATITLGKAVKKNKAQVGQPVKAQAPMRYNGYDFLRWEATSGVGDLSWTTNAAKTATTVTFTMPAEETLVTAVYAIDDKYRHAAILALNGAKETATQDVTALKLKNAQPYLDRIVDVAVKAAKVINDAETARAVDAALAVGKAAMQAVVNEATILKATDGTDGTNKIVRLSAPVCYEAFDAWCKANKIGRNAALQAPGAIFSAAFGQTNLLSEAELKSSFVITSLATVASAEAGTQWRLTVNVKPSKLPYAGVVNDALVAVAFGVDGAAELKAEYKALEAKPERIISGKGETTIWFLAEPPNDAKGKPPAAYFFRAKAY